jgi:Transglutaminase-like superfamily
MMTTNHQAVTPANNKPSDWLGATRLLDLDDSRLRIQAMRITQLASTDVQKATLIHDFIKAMPFGCVAGFDHVPAVSVLKSGHGDCHTKGTLFVALLRCAGVPARLRFVTLTGEFLHGIIDMGQNTITHAVGEVYLQERWVQTDTYVTDSILEAQAMTLLTQHNISTGYGIHRQGKRFWNGLQHAHGQYAGADPSSLPRHDWGVAHDPEQFYSSTAHPQLHMGWLTRAKWMIAAGVVNRRVQKVREAV